MMWRRLVGSKEFMDFPTFVQLMEVLEEESVRCLDIRNNPPKLFLSFFLSFSPWTLAQRR